MISVVIPAHNESSVIERTLDGLLKSIGDRKAEIVVVCNGCSDNTAEIARGYGGSVRVIETNQAGKWLALNLGDQSATGFPRLYLDADIVVSPNMISMICEALDNPKPRAAWPIARYQTENASWVVRAFYHVWTNVPYNRPGRIGVGAYALNEAARERFEEFPNIMSDDGFIRGLFVEHERVIVDECYTNVRIPTNLHSLIKIRTRSRLGLYQMRSLFPDVLKGHSTKGAIPKSSVFFSLMSPSMLLSLPVYLLVNLATRLRASSQFAAKQLQWERDYSSREA